MHSLLGVDLDLDVVMLVVDVHRDVVGLVDQLASLTPARSSAIGTRTLTCTGRPFCRSWNRLSREETRDAGP
jgi:hypothetical protein